MEKTWVVVKVKNNQVVLLNTIDGSFKNVCCSQKQIPLIGENFEYSEQNTPKIRFVKIAAVACMLALVVSLFGLFHTGNSQSAYLIAMDINPSIEVHISKDLIITELTSLNTDGDNVIKNINYKNKNYKETMELIIAECIEQNYLKQHEANLITTTIIPLQKFNKIKEIEVENTINESLSSHYTSATINVFTGKEEIIEEAHKFSISINKYRIYKELKDRGINITLDETKNKTLKDLLSLENKFKSNRNSEINQPQTGGNSNGYNNSVTNSYESKNTIPPNGTNGNITNNTNTSTPEKGKYIHTPDANNLNGNDPTDTDEPSEPIDDNDDPEENEPVQIGDDNDQDKNSSTDTGKSSELTQEEDELTQIDDDND
ncbi:MAG TPA: hypothetical protein VIO64_19545 [Pseudobacteroides sp.]|uniref:anti-sigma-I factor RsgI family protein n=1 Tax=Pseudobacteroides sp. TaxID=1968840 RepID=UPI002F944986